MHSFRPLWGGPEMSDLKLRFVVDGQLRKFDFRGMIESPIPSFFKSEADDVTGNVLWSVNFNSGSQSKLNNAEFGV